MVPLMEEEMSFLAKLIVQKRAEPLFREAPATFPVHLHAHYSVADALTLACYRKIVWNVRSREEMYMSTATRSHV